MSRRDNVYCKKERNSALSNLAVSEHFPSPQLPLRGQEAACHCPCPSPLPWLPRVSANCVWDGDACQLGIELRVPYASEQLSDGNDFLPLVLILPATERACIVRSFWSHPTPTEVTLCLFHYSWSLLESKGPLAAHTADTILYSLTERAEPGSAELTWNARLTARGAGQVPGKINSTEPPEGGKCWLLLCIAALCQVICDFTLASAPKGELCLRSPRLARKSRESAWEIHGRIR